MSCAVVPAERLGQVSKSVKAAAGPLVSAAPARAHLEALRAAGIGTRAIAATAGVARSGVGDVLAGRTGRIRAETSRRLLAVSVAGLSGHVLVDAAPTVALLGYLVDDLGCSPSWVAAQLGGGGRRVRLQVGRTARVRARTAAAVAELAERVSATAGVSKTGTGL